VNAREPRLDETGRCASVGDIVEKNGRRVSRGGNAEDALSRGERFEG
jgi:hypothetical protein